MAAIRRGPDVATLLEQLNNIDNKDMMFVSSSSGMSAQNVLLCSCELNIWVLTGPLIGNTLIMMAIYKNEITIQ